MKQRLHTNYENINEILNDINSIIKNVRSDNNFDNNYDTDIHDEYLFNLTNLEKYLLSIKAKQFELDKYDQKLLKELYLKNMFRKIKAKDIITILVLGFMAALFSGILLKIKIFAAIILAVIGFFLSLILININFERRLITNCIILIVFGIFIINLLEKIVSKTNILSLFLSSLKTLTISLIGSFAGISFFFFGIFLFFLILTGSVQSAIELIDVEKNERFKKELFELAKKHKSRIEEILNILEELKIKKLNQNKHNKYIN